MTKRILYTQEDGSVAIIIPTGAVEASIKDVPAGLDYEIVDTAEIPSDRTFRNAWQHDTTTAPQKIVTDVPKAKLIAHTSRRAARAEAFAPHDIMATVPAKAVEAEAARQVIRDADSAKQVGIDNAITIDELIKAVG
jgi:hypothetical protein